MNPTPNQQRRPPAPISTPNVPGQVPPRPALQVRPPPRPVGINPRQPPPLAPKPQNLTPLRRVPMSTQRGNVATPPRPRLPGPGHVPHVGTLIPQMRSQSLSSNLRFSTPQPYRSSIPMRYNILFSI